MNSNFDSKHMLINNNGTTIVPLINPKVEICIACGEPTTHNLKRGRCPECYKVGLASVKEGASTWEFMEEMGFALPLKKDQKHKKKS